MSHHVRTCCPRPSTTRPDGDASASAPPRRHRSATRSSGCWSASCCSRWSPSARSSTSSTGCRANVTRIPGVFDGLDDRPSQADRRAGDAVNVLVVGTDRRSDVPTTGSDARAAAWVPGAQRSDALMILHISADRAVRRSSRSRVTPGSTCPGYGMNKINAAFSFAGPSLTIQTVELLTSVRIDHLAVIDWSGFEALIDAVGGIDVTVPETVDGLGARHHLDRRRAPPRRPPGPRLRRPAPRPAARATSTGSPDSRSSCAP